MAGPGGIRAQTRPRRRSKQETATGPNGAIGRLGGWLIALATVAVFVVGLGEAGRAAQQAAPALRSLVLNTADLPAGFVYDAESGPVSAATATALGGSPRKVNDLGPGWVSAWTAPNQLQVRIAVVDLFNTTDAAKAVQGARRSYHRLGLATFTAPTVPGGIGGAWISTRRAQEGIAVGFARGSLLFTVIVLAPQRFNVTELGALSALLSARELRHESARYAGGQPAVVGGAGLVSGAIGAVVGYLLVLSGWAYLRDPLARARWSRRRRRASAIDATDVNSRIPTLDVTADARALRRSAVTLIGLSLAAFGVALGGFRPNPLTTRVILWSSGLAVGVATAAYRARRGRRSSALWMVNGQRPWSATALFVVAIATAVFACASLLAGTLGASGAPDSQGYLIAAACFAAVAGVAHRRAQRLSSVAAGKALERDTRRPVLYLRSFGDDTLRMRSATLGRASLIDRLSPNRFDSFEEIIVRHLSAIGPVIAVNQPGTRLAPLGAARETIDADDWHAAVDEWMERASLIVIGAPPGAPSPGLAWELERVSREAWRERSVVIVPPVPSEQIRERWSRFAGETADWPSSSELGGDPDQVLAMVRRDTGWLAIVSRRRTEWTYAAALAAASRDPVGDASAAQPPLVMSGARGSMSTPSCGAPL